MSEFRLTRVSIETTRYAKVTSPVLSHLKKKDMEIKPQDYIHLYLGCDVSNGIEVGKLVGVTESEYERGKTISLIDFGADNFYRVVC